MKLTHGEIRGVVALGVLLSCILGGLALHRSCTMADLTNGVAEDYPLVHKMKNRVDSVSRLDSVAADEGKDRKRRKKIKKTRSVAVPDRPSPLDDVNSCY